MLVSIVASAATITVLLAGTAHGKRLDTIAPFPMGRRLGPPAVAGSALFEDSSTVGSKKCCCKPGNCTGSQSGVTYLEISLLEDTYCCKNAYSTCEGSLWRQNKYKSPLADLLATGKLVKNYDPASCEEVPPEYDPVTQIWDISKKAGFDASRVWVCDIEERGRDEDNDFLFVATITKGGSALSSGAKEGDTCIFQDVMYDIQDFKPDYDDDGLLDFSIKFGKNTRERRDAKDGWVVAFKNLKEVDGRWEGTIRTSWWGDLPVRLFSYASLSKEMQAKLPDFIVSKYFKTKS